MQAGGGLAAADAARAMPAPEAAPAAAPAAGGDVGATVGADAAEAGAVGAQAAADAPGEDLPMAIDWGDKEEELRRLLTCTICKQLLYEAVTINECMHSFCKACCEAHYTMQASQRRGVGHDDYKCPQCEIKLPSNVHDITLPDDSLDKMAAALFPREHARRRELAQRLLREARAEADAAPRNGKQYDKHYAVPSLMARSERGKRPAAKPKNHGTPKRSRVEGATSAVVPAAPAAAHYAVAPATAGHDGISGPAEARANGAGSSSAIARPLMSSLDTL